MPVYRDEGDALEGDRIACQARKLKQNLDIKGSYKHRANQIILSKYAYCIIEKPLIRIR